MTHLTIDLGSATALDLSLDGVDVEVITRPTDDDGVIARLPLAQLRSALDSLSAVDEAGAREVHAELSDADSDALAITTRHELTWITCTSGEDEVTVGPFPTTAITGALPPHKPVQVASDVLDGGVTAARIEQEEAAAARAGAARRVGGHYLERRGGPALARVVGDQRHPDPVHAVHPPDPIPRRSNIMTTDPHIYKGEYCNLHIRPSDAPESVEVEVFSQKRKNGLWIEVPVAKVRSMLAASVLPGSYTRTDEPVAPRETVEFWQARWKEAADRADARDAAAHAWKETARRLTHRVREIAWERDDARGDCNDALHREKAEQDRAVKAEQKRAEARSDLTKAVMQTEAQAKEIHRLRAAQPRPLTPDAIESVLHDILPLTTEHLKADDIAGIASDLYTALTEPPRPTELQVLAKVSAYMDEAGGEGIDAVTDFLAERGVRVVTEEQP